MDLTFISDTHSKHREIELGSGEVLCHCGDITGDGELRTIKDFAEYFGQSDFKHKIVIAGNHDFCFENKNQEQEAIGYLEQNGIIYLNDSGVEIDGVKFWGSPIQPWFFDWAFNRQRGEDIKKHWDLIPTDTDVLLTHGPPSNILDLCKSGQRVGCEELLIKVREVRPKIHAFGHIHESYGKLEFEGIKFLNACSLDHRYDVKNPPIKISI
ncbi:metallophosphatase domain-containing protein [Bacteriovoracaceae bacterium]|nr:metallophosphatase domain-containing protein [Bacteriovoracaceae bacterium]